MTIPHSTPWNSHVLSVAWIWANTMLLWDKKKANYHYHSIKRKLFLSLEGWAEAFLDETQ